MLSLEGVSFRYHGQAFSVENVHLEVRRGEVLALVGANGSGKTTLLKLLIGLLKPQRGEATLDGVPLQKIPERELFSRVSMVFQDPEDQIFMPTPLEDVGFGLVNQVIDHKEIYDIAIQALASVGMEGKSTVPVRNLSHGEKKRVALAGVLAMRPQYLLLDEPTAGLDPMGSYRFMELLCHLKTEQGMGMVVATHDMDMIPVFCDRMAVLSKGTCIIQGPVKEVFSRKELIRQADLRLPRVTHLLEILSQKDGFPDCDPALTIGQARRSLRRVIGLEG